MDWDFFYLEHQFMPLPRTFVIPTFLSSLVFALFLIGASARADNGILIQNGQTLAFLGDSLTAHGWELPGGYVRLVIDGLGKEGVKVTPIPSGGSGQTSQDMLGRLDRDILSKHPAWMTLSCGVNDVWVKARAVDLATYKKNVTAIVDQATAAGVKVVLMTPTVISEEDNANNQQLVGYDDFIRTFAKERNLPLADCGGVIRAALEKLPTSPLSRNLTVDGVHMNPEGNVLMAKEVLRALGVPPADLEKIEQEWLTQPDTANFTLPFVFKADVGISLGQYRALEAYAQSHQTTVQAMEATLWLRTVADVVASHAQDVALDPVKIQAETLALLPRKIADLAPVQP